MPLCKIQTNLPRDKIPKDFVSNFAEMASRVFDKPLERVLVTVVAGVDMLCWSKSDPAALVEISAIDRFSPETNKTYGPPVLDFLNQALGLPDDRLSVAFYPVEAYQLAKRS